MDKNLLILKDNLTNLGYTAYTFDNKSEATQHISQQLNNKTIGIGGSLTVEQMGLYEKLIENNTVWWHWRIPNNMTDKEVRLKERESDIYISSVNGISINGEIVNIDATCNRVSDILFGHEKVYLIVGKNKITETLDSAIYRARNIAAPLNAKRLGKNTPCAINADQCYNCNCPDRICRDLSIMWQKPLNGNYEIIIINEDLGY